MLISIQNTILIIMICTILSTPSLVKLNPFPKLNSAYFAWLECTHVLIYNMKPFKKLNGVYFAWLKCAHVLTCTFNFYRFWDCQFFGSPYLTSSCIAWTTPIPNQSPREPPTCDFWFNLLNQVHSEGQLTKKAIWLSRMYDLVSPLKEEKWA